MSLETYQDLIAPAVSDASKRVYQLVGTRIHDTQKPMPPQGALGAAELAALDQWVAAGAPSPSSAACSTTSAAPADTWPTDCDATYTLVAHGAGGASTPYVVPAGQELHPKISVPAPWGSQALQAIAFRSITDNPKVLHHWILYGPQREFLVGWAPGKQVITTTGKDVGMNLAGGTLTLDMHYNNLQTQLDQPDRSGVEVCVRKPEHFRKNTAAVFMGFAQVRINLPAHSTGVEVTGRCKLTGSTPVTLLTASPHAHTLARRMKLSVQRASGEVVTMHDAAFQFDEQQSYALSPPVVVSQGDTVITTCVYDNTTDRAVTFGENTENEMCFNFASYYPMNAIACSGGGFGL
jgi:hypothetical protein